MGPTDDKMEPEDNLAESYVADFVLDHLEQVAVKKEGGGMERLPPSMLCGGNLVSMSQSPPPPPSHLLTPPGHHSDDYGMVGPHSNLVVHGPMMYPDTPGTPPDTPPESSSPHSPAGRHFPPLEPQLLPPYRGGQMLPDEVHWPIMMANGLRQEPLDLRPNGPNEMGMEEWGPLQQVPQPPSGKRISNGLDFHHHHLHHAHLDSDELSLSPMSSHTCKLSGDYPMPTKSDHGIDDAIDDELLMCLSVRELNKRLHGYPRDAVVRLKQKRRTLKNRGYAQNCRSKRLHQRHELEVTNRTLQNEVHRLKLDNSRLLQERDMYKHRCDILKKKVDFYTAQVNQHESSIASPDLYERFQ